VKVNKVVMTKSKSKNNLSWSTGILQTGFFQTYNSSQCNSNLY
jgi:hypothetical protein